MLQLYTELLLLLRDAAKENKNYSTGKTAAVQRAYLHDKLVCTRHERQSVAVIKRF